MSDSVPPPARGAVFLSYAREDTAAAQRIAEALRSHGVEVWFDQDELRGGDAWDGKIKKQIRDCTLFLPLVSKHTQERSEGYFRREWLLAVERTRDMHAGVAFVVPVVIDETREADAAVPEEFMRYQWTRLSGALPTTQFVEQIKRLLETPRKATAAARSANSPAASPSPAPRPSGIPTWLAAVVGVVLLGAAAYFAMRPTAKEPPVAPPKIAAENKTSVAPAAASASPKVSDKSIAVLPFTNMSDDKDTGYFTDGVHEDILTHLALIPELKVVSRTTVVQYRDSKKTLRQIGAELGVAYILEGSVRRSGNKVRVTGQLINARTDEHVWARSYDRDLTDVFAIQASLSQEIASALQAAITPQAKKFIERRPTENPVAYDAYLKGRNLRNTTPSGLPVPLKQAEAFFQTAVEQDPNFAEAWGELAIAHALHVFWDIDHTPARLARADAAIAHAVRLAPDTPDVIRAIGTYALYGHRDYARATAEYEKLARLQPNDPTAFATLGLIQRRQGKWAESLASLRKATELEPTNVNYWRYVREIHLFGRRWEEAMAAERREITLVPDSIDLQRNLAVLYYLATGSRKEEEELFARKAAADPNAPYNIAWRITLAATMDYPEFKRLDALQPFFDGDGVEHPTQALNAAVVYAAHGDLTAAHSRLADFPTELRARLEREPANARAHIYLAQTEALLGHRDEALRLAQQATELLPESLDAVDGPVFTGRAAEIYAWTGEKDRALAALAHLLREPCGAISFFSTGANSVHRIRDDPWFTPLRGDPRFEALLNDPKNSEPLF